MIKFKSISKTFMSFVLVISLGLLGKELDNSKVFNYYKHENSLGDLC